MKIIKLSLFLATAAFVVGCSGERENDPVATSSLDPTQKALVEDQILPSVEAFLTNAKAFEASTNSFCSATSSDKLVTVQAGWKQLSASWNSIELFTFGPINDDLFTPAIDFINSYRKRGTNYIETNRDFISNNMTSNDTINFDTLNFNKTGLLMLELLAFETSDDTHSTDNAAILAEYNGNDRKCYMLEGFADQITRHAQYISDGWNVEFKSSGQPYKDIYLSGTLEDGSESLATLLTKVQEELDYIKKRHVVTTVAQISQTSWENAQANIDAIDLMMEGTTNESFFNYMLLTGSKSSVDTVRTNIQSVKDAISAEDVASYEAAIGLLDGNFKREIPDALSIDLGINFSDGD